MPVSRLTVNTKMPVGKEKKADKHGCAEWFEKQGHVS